MKTQLTLNLTFDSDESKIKFIKEITDLIEFYNRTGKYRVILNHFNLSKAIDKELLPDADNYETQTQMVLNHIKQHGSITSLQAFKLYNITRISHAILQLRKAGYGIKTTMQKSKVNKHKRYGIYHF